MPEPDAPPPASPPEPGDRRPPGMLERPPSDRYRPAGAGAASAGAGGASAGSGASPGSGSARGTAAAPGPLRGLGPATGVALIGAAIDTLVGGVLAEHRGLLAVAAIAGAVLGLLAATAAVSPDGITPPWLARRTVVRASIGLALGMVALGAIGIWIVARLEGGVLAPLDYLWETTGLLFPAQAILASLGAAWGAGAGPVRGRS